MALRWPQDVLATLGHAGFDCVVMNNGSGFRCGYVRIPIEHPWHGLSDECPAEVHGGVTYGALDEPTTKVERDGVAWWIGFDCAHHLDAPDPDLPLRPGRHGFPAIFEDCVVRTQEYVESECRSLCEQAALALTPSPQTTTT